MDSKHVKPLPALLFFFLSPCLVDLFSALNLFSALSSGWLLFSLPQVKGRGVGRSWKKSFASQITGSPCSQAWPCWAQPGLPAPEQILVLTSASASLLPPPGGFCLAQNGDTLRVSRVRWGSEVVTLRKQSSVEAEENKHDRTPISCMVMRSKSVPFPSLPAWSQPQKEVLPHI